MKKITLVCGLFLPIFANAQNNCRYAEVGSPSYVIADKFKKYAAMSFFTQKESQTTKMASLDNNKLNGLIDSEFKVIDTGLETPMRTYWMGGASQNRFADVSVGGGIYTLDKSLSTKIITPSCDVFFMASSDAFIPMSFNMGFKRLDGVEMSDSDYLILNGKNLSIKNLDATVSYDRFENLVKIRTKEFDGMLLRGSYNPTSKNMILTQLYLDTTFYGSWGNIKVAYDEGGKTHEVVMIDYDADCSNKHTSCQLKETLGVNLSESYLRSNKGGFELKLKGKQDKYIKIEASMIQSYLNGIEKAKNTSTN